MAKKDKKKVVKKKVVKKKVDEDSLNKIIDGVVEKVVPAMSKKVSKMVDKKIEATEKTIRKNVKGKVNIHNKDIENEPTQVRFIKAAKALRDHDYKTLRKYNEHAINLRQKSDYGNSVTNADGAYLVPDPDFEAAVEKLMPTYGIAFQYANVVPINGDSVKTNSRGSNVTMYRTAQAGSKTGTKLSIDQDEVSLDKFAAIAPATDELVEDAAVDYWNEVTQGFAEERARWADRLVFTEDALEAKTYGIFHTSGVYAETVGAAITSVTWDDLLDAENKIPDAADQNARWFMHKTLWNVIKKSKDDDGRYQALPSGAKETPWGKEIVTGDIFPTVNAVGDSNEPYAVYGDLRRTKLYMKRGLVLTMLTEGTVNDAGGSEINLALQDMTALRAVTRMVHLCKFPEAFCILGTGTVS